MKYHHFMDWPVFCWLKILYNDRPLDLKVKNHFSYFSTKAYVVDSRVLRRNVSMRRSFKHPKHMLKLMC